MSYSIPSIRNNLLLPCENKEFFNLLKNNDLSCSLGEQSFNGYYYMVTIKNNTSPKVQLTDPDRYCKQAGRLFLKGFKHIKSAFELDSKQQLHLHLVVRHDKNIHRVKMSQELKKYEPTFVHDIKPILTENHLMNAMNYLDGSKNQLVISRYLYEWVSNDDCDFIDTTSDIIRDGFQAYKNNF